MITHSNWSGILSQLEPRAAEAKTPSLKVTAEVSIAISLKRIADALTTSTFTITSPENTQHD